MGEEMTKSKPTTKDLLAEATALLEAWANIRYRYPLLSDVCTFLGKVKGDLALWNSINDRVEHHTTNIRRRSSAARRRAATVASQSVKAGSRTDIGYTIGYAPFDGLAALTVPDLIRTMDTLGADILVDVRSEPKSRIHGFGQANLIRALGSRYTWEGNRLGGRGKIGQSGLTMVESLIRAGKVPMLLCKERAPGVCHRHFKIAIPLLERGIDITHVYDDQLVLTSDLQKALDTDSEYEAREWKDNVVAIA